MSVFILYWAWPRIFSLFNDGLDIFEKIDSKAFSNFARNGSKNIWDVLVEIYLNFTWFFSLHFWLVSVAVYTLNMFDGLYKFYFSMYNSCARAEVINLAEKYVPNKPKILVITPVNPPIAPITSKILEVDLW